MNNNGVRVGAWPATVHRLVEMGKRGPQPKAKGKAPAAPLPKPQGTTTKRTPTSAFDSAAGKDIYEPEKVVAQRTAKGGVTQFCRVINRQLTGCFETQLKPNQLPNWQFLTTNWLVLKPPSYR